MFLQSKQEKPLVQFFSTVKHLNSIEECVPKSANKFVPSWWKTLPKQSPFPDIQTVKMCPSFPEFFSQGYVIPMWTDCHISYKEDTKEWKWNVASNTFEIGTHDNDQFLNFVTPKFQGSSGKFIFKFINPWNAITPPGYSLLQLPMFYNFNNDFSVLPGVIHTDMHHELNLQIVYYSDKPEIFIPRGTPLVQYIPFKRTDYQLITRDATQEDLDTRDRNRLNIFSKYVGSGVYRKRFKKLGE